MNEDDMNFNTEALATLFERAARKTAEPIEFETDETTEVNTDNLGACNVYL